MVESEKKKGGGEKKTDQQKMADSLKGQKILLDTMPPRSGSCAFHNLFYALFGVLAALYVAFSLDKPAFLEYADKFSLGCVYDLFAAVDKYSPFQEFLESDQDFIDRLKKENPSVEDKVKVFTKEELKKYDGSPGSPGLYLAILGKVYDVSKGADYYGPGGGYAFFTGRDGSRAFVTGQFDEEGLIDDTKGLANGDYLGLKEWEEFYSSDYSLVGLLEGTYYTRDGEVTQAWKDLQNSISVALRDKDNKDVEKQVFPPCNVEWSQDKGTRFWCTTKSGGIKRKWVGVPRRLFYPGREERCACIRDSGAPSTDPGASSDRGDLDNPHLKPYPGCASDTAECWTQEEK